MLMTITPIAYFRSPFKSKFGVPRQSGLVAGLRGRIEFAPEYRCADALRGLDGYDYLWLIWGFSANAGAGWKPTVRPPRLGGNKRMGVFATRSPFRPNGLGLSAVRLERVELGAEGGPVIHVSGADLMDGTPVYDIKPYLAFADSHAGARCGFVAAQGWATLRVECEPGLLGCMGESDAAALLDALAQDPRPHYQDDPGRVYGMPFGDWDVRFTVSGGVLRVVAVEPAGRLSGACRTPVPGETE